MLNEYRTNIFPLTISPDVYALSICENIDIF